MEPATPLIVVVMGVMGCGKSTVAALLAQALGAPFYEGDSFHSPANIAKMQAGTPLCDDDRWPWLQQLADVIQRHLTSGQPAVLSCSALKPAYRQLLCTGRCPGSGVADRAECGNGSSSMACSSRHAAGAAGPGSSTMPTVQADDGAAPSSSRVGFVLLDPPRHELEQRLLRRTAAGGHFTPGAALLDSQLAALEYEEAELLLHVRGDPFPSAELIVAAVLQRCGRAGLAG